MLKVRIFTLLIFTLTLSFTILGCGGGGGGGESKGSISGVVTLEGMSEGEYDAVVIIEETQKAYNTSPNGSYSIPDLTAGTYTVTALRNFYVSQSKPVVVSAGQETTGVNFHLTYENPPDLPAKLK
jgi:hypothetical protein